MLIPFDRLLDVIAIVFGAGGVLAFIINIRRVKSQNTLDLSAAWEKFATPLMDRLKDLETKVSDQENEIEDLRGYVGRLVKQLIDAGLEPVEFSRRKQPPKG
jgi:hypothetical protein